MKALKRKYDALPSETRLSIRCFATDAIVCILFVIALIVIEYTT